MEWAREVCLHLLVWARYVQARAVASAPAAGAAVLGAAPATLAQEDTLVQEVPRLQGVTSALAMTIAGSPACMEELAPNFARAAVAVSDAIAAVAGVCVCVSVTCG